MNGELKEDDGLIRNLKDAGCSPRMIENFLKCRVEHRICEQRRILSTHRKRLLDQVHKDQGKLDRLDHLLFHWTRMEWKEV